MDTTGIHDNTSDIGDGFTTMENMSFFVGDEIGRRLGFGAQIVNTGIVCCECNGLVIFVKSNGNIESESQ